MSAGHIGLAAALLMGLWSASAQAQEKTLKRTLDPVVVGGEKLTRLQGSAIEHLRLYAFQRGQWIPIPYQIDKKDPDGEFIINTNTVPDEVRDEAGFDDTPEYEKREERIDDFEDDRKDFEKQVARGELSREQFERLRREAYHVEVLDELDYNDELVFMARDAGARASKESWLVPDGLELEVRDPLAESTAWVYLFAFGNEVPARSAIDYVDYDPATDTVNARLGVIDFVDDKPLIVESLVGKHPRGIEIPNVLDRFKVRIKVKPAPLFCIPLHFDENNVKAFTIGYKDGPVRVIRRNIFWIIIGGVRLPFAPKIVIYFQFYENGLATKAEVWVPVDADWFVCDGSSMVAGLDLNENARGAKIFTRDNSNIVIDGRMSEAEKNLKIHNQFWIAGYLPNDAALMSRMIYDKRLLEKGAVMDLALVDDDNSLDPPENDPGQHLIGYTMDIGKMPKGRYNVGFQIYVAYDFEPGDVAELLNIDDNPLEVQEAADDDGEGEAEVPTPLAPDGPEQGPASGAGSGDGL